MDDVSQTAAPRTPWHKSPWILGLAGAILYALSFPPADFWPLAWVALLPWLRLIAIDELPKFSREAASPIASKGWVRRFLGNVRSIPKRPYGIIYLCALVHWLMVLHFLRLPFWATGIAGFFLSAYCAGYIPLFIGLSRVAVHRWRLPLPLVVALVWMGFEYMRQWFLSGFAMACLAHTQYRFYSLIQVAEFGGATLVSGLILLPAAWLAEVLWSRNRAMTAHLLSGTTIVAIFVAVLFHGQECLDKKLVDEMKVLLVQGNVDTTFDNQQMNEQQSMHHYDELTRQGLSIVKSKTEMQTLSLIVWPESMMKIPYITVEKDYDATSKQVSNPTTQESQRALLAYLSSLGKSFDIQNAMFLCGVTRYHYRNSSKLPDIANSAIDFGIYEGFARTQVYDKQHRVPFGEFVPFGDWVPWLYDATPLSRGIIAGEHATSHTTHWSNTRYSVTICYESVMPQVTRHQMLELRERNETPAVLINLTNDGWFWGSSELDLHLVCGVFRAVEARRPFLIAANTGMSAAIDPLGRITAQGKRHEPDMLFVHAEVLADQPEDYLTFYHRYGELPGMIGLAFSAIVLAYSIFKQNTKPT